MIEEFINWAQNKRPLLQARDILTATARSPPSAKPSARMDIDTKKALARITLWSDGSCHMEVIDLALETTIFERHVQLSSLQQLEEESKGLFDMLV